MVRPGMLCKPTKVAAASCQALLPEFNHSGDGSSMSFFLRQVRSPPDRLNFSNCEERIVFCFLILATLAVQHRHDGRILTTVLVRRSRSTALAKAAPTARNTVRLEHVLKKVARHFLFRHAPTL